MQIPMWVKKIIKPARIVRIHRTLGDRKREPICILDVGCGPNVMYTKPYFNVREYHGVDRGMRPGFEANYKNMDKLFCMDLERLELGEIPDGHYDLVILSHVIEHLSNGLELIGQISSKVAPRGCLYIESPSMRTINYPSAVGFMNFYDDPTHKRLYSDQEVIRSLQELRSAGDSCGVPVELASGGSGAPGVALAEPLLLHAVQTEDQFLGSVGTAGHRQSLGSRPRDRYRLRSSRWELRWLLRLSLAPGNDTVSSEAPALLAATSRIACCEIPR